MDTQYISASDERYEEAYNEAKAFVRENGNFFTQENVATLAVTEYILHLQNLTIRD